VSALCQSCGRPRLLDLFSNAGGAGMGYHRAGFCVTGVDHVRFRRYPFRFVKADALQVLRLVLNGYLQPFAAIHASCPCQFHTLCQRIRGNEHPELIEPTRELLEQIGVPWVMENVVGAPLRDPMMLCGAMFPGLRVYRHRLFESNVPLTAPRLPAGTLGARMGEACGWPHLAPLTKMGRPPRPGEFMHVVGNFSGVQQAREAMGIGWMARDELRESIPPAFTEHVGMQLLEHLALEAAA
jgi:DNA (cytosine-5)-methyltransferase 1